MTDSPTLKAIVSTLLTLVFLFCVGAVGKAIGHASTVAQSPEANSYAQADTPAPVVSHNYPAGSTSSEVEVQNEP